MSLFQSLKNAVQRGWQAAAEWWSGRKPDPNPLDEIDEEPEGLPSLYNGPE